MRSLLVVGATAMLFLAVGCSSSQRTAKVACATCIYDMKGVSGCKLAVKVDGEPYLVSGVAMKDLGNAHAAHGLCNTERKAKVEGRVEDDRFVAKWMELLPQP